MYICLSLIDTSNAEEDHHSISFCPGPQYVWGWGLWSSIQLQARSGIGSVLQVCKNKKVLCWHLSDLKVKLQIRKNKFSFLFNLSREILLKKAKIKAKKKPRRRSDSSGGYTLSDIIQSPPAAGKIRHTMDWLQRSMFFISLTMFYASQSFSARTCQAPSCFGNRRRAIMLLKRFFFLLLVISPSLVKSDKVNSAESLQELLTSDSEGSCMGVGSPRDMQSPVFHDRVEVNDWALAKKTFLLNGKSSATNSFCSWFLGKGDKLVCRLQVDKTIGQKLKTPPSTPTSLRDAFPTPPNSAPRTIPKVPPRWDTFTSPSEHLQSVADVLGFTLQKMLLMFWKKSSSVHPPMLTSVIY